MPVAFICLVLLAAEPKQPFTSPASPAAEYGHGLTAKQALAGWISLFDGKTTYGWTDAKCHSGALSGGRTTSSFVNFEIQGEAQTAGELLVGDKSEKLTPGKFQLKFKLAQPAPIRLGEGLALTQLTLKPLGLKSKFNGEDFTGLTVLKHPRRPAEEQAKWVVEDGYLRAVGGPGAVELAGHYGDLVLRVEVRTRHPLVNGGVFVRSIPGDFMNGYEAQLFNACYDQDPDKPARYSTGAIDDRMLARRLVSRDEELFVMTVIAQGPHISTWVNGYQTVDWTDTRELHDNPRQGLRLKPGSIQLQAHDSETDIEFRRVLVGL